FQALYGERPFEGRTLEDLRQAILTDQVRPAPKGSKVPAFVRRALLHGLRGGAGGGGLRLQARGRRAVAIVQRVRAAAGGRVGRAAARAGTRGLCRDESALRRRRLDRLRSRAGRDR